MSDRSAFFDYVRRFELAHLTDDWSLIEACFAPDATHLVTGGGVIGCDDRGRAGVVDGLRRSVHEVDRRFDARIAEIVEGPVTREGGLWMRFRLTLVRQGLPELSFEGEHLAVYEDGVITRLDECPLDGASARVDAFLAEHDGVLHAVGAAPARPEGALAERVLRAAQRSIVRAYGAAKSEQDIEGALGLCAEDFAIETLAFGVTSRDRADTERQLGHFFRALPDYRAEPEGLASQGDCVAWWGRIAATLEGTLLPGLEPTGKRAELPAFCVFDLRGTELVRERFFFDLAALCAGFGLPLEKLQQQLAALRSAA